MIVCEIGQNHCGDMGLATKLIDLAKPNPVKFQLYDSIKLYGEKQKSELSKEQAKYLFEYGKAIGTEVFFSVFDTERIGWCEEFGVKRYKLAYSQRWNRTLISEIDKTRKEIIISSDLDDFLMRDVYNSKLTWLYCVSDYPAKVNLKLISKFDGFSDHTIGLDATKVALSRGAKIIEKHFAIDHETGVDSRWSMTPDELKELRRFEDSVREMI